MIRPEEIADLEARTEALLASDRLTRPTQRALRERLYRRFGPPRVLSAAAMRTLEAVALRMIPEPALVARVALAQAFEAQLAMGAARGWRYADAPPDVELHDTGLAALDRAASGRFADLSAEAQDALLACAARGDIEAAGPIDIWFEELVTALAELFYAHPLVQVAIGYDGMADAKGMEAVGLVAVQAEATRGG